MTSDHRADELPTPDIDAQPDDTRDVEQEEAPKAPVTTAYKVKRCAECKLEIPAEATICSHCDSYQDWRRFFAVGNMTLTSIIALFSVLGIAILIILDAFRPKSAILHSEVFQGVDRTITLLVSNTGTLDGYIGSASLVADGNIFSLLTESATTVSAESSIPVRMAVDDNRAGFLAGSEECAVVFALLDHQLTESTFNEPLDCRAFE
ncbi:hypothetical protein EDD52_1432 [Primorskyibacter sedentarius]|uniref:Uncharacterized protein n=1 Tax=Primorskyibacter sedentarius TaxID=745311 RepID=A0A4R3IN17_9RHOB|nr:hypothetical protein [Primorskyibacter sedentarius]TCS51112.1 hypothetical protein EDD52_1432 [Primorskyibacter sedentarius]